MTPVAVTAGLTEELATTAVVWEHPDQDAAWDLAERAFTDTVAVSLAAVHDPTVVALLAGIGADLRGGPSAVWVRGCAGDSRTAALINGGCAHALDFDDVDDQTIGHPSAVLVPTVMALGEELGTTGAEALDAYWAGLAVSRALAAALDIDGHYRAGWHSTGTIGAIGAAAAAVRLRALPVDRARHALGIAGSLAAGSRQNFGTMTKPLHAGVAAANGILATKLAAAGYTADPSQLEQPLGYLALHAGAPGRRRVAAERMSEPRLNVKLHACCYYIHAAADAMLELVAAGLQADQVRRVVVTGPPQAFGPLIHSRPRTGLQGKFSMEYAMAACLLDRSLGLTVFTDDAVTRADAQRLIETVRLEPSPTPPMGSPQWSWNYAVVSVETTDGQHLARRVDEPRGHGTRPLEDSELRQKFDDCLVHGGFTPSDELYRALRHLRGSASSSEASDVVADLARSSSAGSSTSDAVAEGAAR